MKTENIEPVFSCIVCNSNARPRRDLRCVDCLSTKETRIACGEVR